MGFHNKIDIVDDNVKRLLDLILTLQVLGLAFYNIKSSVPIKSKLEQLAAKSLST